MTTWLEMREQVINILTPKVRPGKPAKTIPKKAFDIKIKIDSERVEYICGLLESHQDLLQKSIDSARRSDLADPHKFIAHVLKEGQRHVLYEYLVRLYVVLADINSLHNQVDASIEYEEISYDFHS